jgi:hypothetical protein
MGLLDDAIRQHLELKRQHGAPEDEVQRQEEEALGPVRRDVAPAEPSGGDGEVELESPDEAPDAEAAPEAHEEETELFEPDAEPEEPVTVLEEPESEAVAEPEAPFEPEPEEEPQAADEWEPDGVPEPDAVPPSPAPFDASTAFQELGEEEPAKDEPAMDEPEKDEPKQDEPESGEADVLEDTPDFLQETPEHDRLWFEQKPPRDFDFD